MRYYKCIDNFGREDILFIGMVYRGELRHDRIFIIDKHDMFYPDRFIEVTNIVLRDRKLSRVL